LKAAREREFLDHLRRHEALIHKICQVYATDSLTKQDLFQEIVLQLWKSFESFRNESKMSTWMYRIALNTALMDKRKSKTTVSLSFFNLLNDERAEEIDDGPQQENKFILYNAIAKLTEIEKAIVMLYLDDKSYEQMEDILGVSQGTLRVKMTRIKVKLRQLSNVKQHGT
jgi:RNA polymerase sigma-70 factor (ECF subfamily)